MLKTCSVPSSAQELAQLKSVYCFVPFHRNSDIRNETEILTSWSRPFLPDPMLIYPNIVNMLGEMTVDVNAICLDKSQTYILMIEQRQTATCTVLTSAIARCNLPKIYDWGTKTVYFQPQSGGANDEKAFVGYIYFVPPTLDPMRLDIGNVYDWFKNPLPYTTMPLVWYPRNFTNPEMSLHMDQVRMNDDSLYSVQLGLYVVAYREYKDDLVSDRVGTGKIGWEWNFDSLVFVGWIVERHSLSKIRNQWNNELLYHQKLIILRLFKGRFPTNFSTGPWPDCGLLRCESVNLSNHRSLNNVENLFFCWNRISPFH